jgi:hypothetical protein
MSKTIVTLGRECPFMLDVTLDRDWLLQNVCDLAVAGLMATRFAALS